MLTFSVLAVVMVIGALGVITLRQPVHASLSLVATLLTLAVSYVTLEAHFLAATQVIVYAGAIMVLFLFVIMLLNIGDDGQELAFKWLRPAAFAVGLLAAAGLVLSVLQNPSQLPDMAVVQAALGGGGAEQVADALFGEFVLAFQLVGVLLLTGIIGAVSLVQRRAEEAAASQEQAVVAPRANVAVATGGVAVLERGGQSLADQASGVAMPDVVPEPMVRAVPASEAKKATVETGKSAATVTSVSSKQVDDQDDAEAKDDLKRISGVGPKLEGLLHDNGIYRFEQIARFSPEDIQRLDEQLGFKGRIERDDWLTQAKELAGEKQ